MLACLLLVGAAPATAEDDGAWLDEIGSRSFDAMVLRPLSAIRLIAGVGLWVPVTAFWPPLHAENFEQFIEEPYRFLIERPLGQDFAGG